ncbi:Pre-mRNA-splicing factor Slu7 [Durusdinium trenchii]|uniref:Pre-mRNA-splicing factor SLU7 n=1 Tax=Durusdinium trenchii TaxID=1381693 RepID=A0ABP0M680_9DINO
MCTGRTEEAQVAMGQNLRAPLILLAQAGTMRGLKNAPSQQEVIARKQQKNLDRISTMTRSKVSRTETAATGQAFLVMAEARAEAAAPDGASGASSPVEAPGKRLLESTLYKEDVLVNEHTAVWGSLFDPESKRWGYKCCKVMEKNGMCTAEKAPEPEANSSDLDNSPDSEDLLGPPKEIIDWSNPPLELKSRESFKDATAWVEHFVRYHVGAWQRKADENYKGFPDLAVTTLKPLLQPSREALEILIRRLHNPRELDRGEKTVRRGRETRAGMEGRVQEEMS